MLRCDFVIVFNQDKSREKKRRENIQIEVMDSLERFIRAAPLPPSLPKNNNNDNNNSNNSDDGVDGAGADGNGNNAGQGQQRRALVHASLATAVGRKGRHLSGTFCLTGDTMEGIIQCLVFLKAFSVSFG